MDGTDDGIPRGIHLRVTPLLRMALIILYTLVLFIGIMGTMAGLLSEGYALETRLIIVVVFGAIAAAGLWGLFQAVAIVPVSASAPEQEDFTNNEGIITKGQKGNNTITW